MLRSRLKSIHLTRLGAHNMSPDFPNRLELPDIEGPTGGNDDENGIESERSEKASEVERAGGAKRNDQYILNAIDEESMAVISYFLEA